MNCKNNNYQDLYQILKIEKNASQQEINNLALTKSSKDNSEVNKALMVLCEPAKRIEYDTKGWQPKWDNEFDEWIAACHDTFEAIHSHIGHGVEAVYHPDGERIWLMGADLDPKLWVPFNSPSADANWIGKIYSIRGENWRGRMKDYENAMLAEIKRVRAERQKTPYVKENWEYVDSGNCAKCGQKAKIRDARGEDTNIYCSQECYFQNLKDRINIEFPKSDFICEICHKNDKDVKEMKDGRYYHKSCFNKKSEKNEKDNGYCVYCQKKNGSETWDWDNTKTKRLEKYCSYGCREKASAEYCDNCQKQIEKRREGHKEIYQGIRNIDSNHQWRVFCSESCEKKWQQKPGNKLGITKLTKLGEFLVKKKRWKCGIWI